MSSSFDPHDSLRKIGFNSLVAQARAALGDAPGILARVVDQARSHCVIHTGTGFHSARPASALARATPLTVGDWVLAVCDEHAQWWVSERLTPYTELHRIDPSGARQALVSNVDCAFLLMGLDSDFNPRRLERYLALAMSAGVMAVPVLTKADLCADIDVPLNLLAQRLPSSVERHAVDARDPGLVDRFAPYLQPGQTVVLLGSSGAGKSTLTNTLAQSLVQETGAVRESDSRGRHTTTSRQLHPLPGGACLIDTPGLRGLRLDIDKTSLDGLFEDIASLAVHCRFRDCAHLNEPGCAVRDGVPADRLANYHKLCREVSRDRADALARQATKATIKSRQRALRAMQKERGR